MFLVTGRKNDSNGNLIKVEAALSNKNLIAELKNFNDYITTNGKRATPHK